MNRYSVPHLHDIGVKLGEHFKGKKNVILVAGGESTPDFVNADRVNAIGAGLKEGCAGENLVTVHPRSEQSSSRWLSGSRWLDFYMSQVKSGKGGEKTDMTPYVAADFWLKSPKPSMVGEHRYEVGTEEDPVIQRRGLYLSVFAGGCGYAYGHNALWQMTPHTAQAWMLSGWKPGVKYWTQRWTRWRSTSCSISRGYCIHGLTCADPGPKCNCLGAEPRYRRPCAGDARRNHREERRDLCNDLPSIRKALDGEYGGNWGEAAGYLVVQSRDRKGDGVEGGNGQQREVYVGRGRGKLGRRGRGG